MTKADHYKGEYHTQSRRLRTMWTRTPTAICARCGRTLDDHPPHAKGQRPKWTAEHTIPGSTTWTPWEQPNQQPPPGDWLTVSASTCNYAAQATPVAARIVTTRSW